MILFRFYGWVVVVAIFGYLILQNRRKVEWVSSTDNILLRIDVPKDNEKKELSAEQMFASLHGILRPRSELIKEGSLQEHISFELVSKQNSIQFYVWTPRHLKDFVESQIYAQYPTVQVQEGAEDYSQTDPAGRAIYGMELNLSKESVLPIKTFASFEVDPLAGITGVLAKLEQMGEEAWIQILARPIDDSWQNHGKAYIEGVKGTTPKPWGAKLTESLLQVPIYVLANFAKALIAPPGAAAAADKKAELSQGQQAMVKAVEEKITKLGYQVKIRIAYLGPDDATARQRLQAIIGGFKQFNTTNLNGFTAGKTYNSAEFLEDYQARLFYDAGYFLNIEELASLYHLPHKTVATPNIVWTTSKTSEPPSGLPTDGLVDAGDVSLFGMTNFRGQHLKFGIQRKDRGRHLYIIGQTGAGKSGLLQLLTLSDVYHDQGFAIVDPHGDYATDIMKYIPDYRLKDVIYMNPADREFPLAFNPMEVTDPAMKDHISSELVGVLKRMFDSWGPRLEYILRYTLLALLDYEGATMLDIPRMLTEKGFRKRVIKEIKDPVVKNFWVIEFASWNEKFASEAVAPILNKVGAFVANPIVRNIVGQKKSVFNIRRVMDDGKILLVNLSRGQVGEDNAAILGSLMVTKIQLAAMSRADMPLEDRRPFYLYVDEFQNFATDSFAVILSEARKYGLNLTVANQYVSQMPEVVRDAVFGNVGSMISFRVGPGDATILGKYFEPVFEPADLTRLNNRNIFISMIINGEKAIPFSATTLRLPDPENDLSEQIIAFNRAQYASRREEVEADIRSRTEEAEDTANSDDQKPNKDLLTALRNPTPAPRAAEPVRDNRGGGNNGGGRPDDRRDRRDRDRGRDRNRQPERATAPMPSGERAGQGQSLRQPATPPLAHPGSSESRAPQPIERVWSAQSIPAAASQTFVEPQAATPAAQPMQPAPQTAQPVAAVSASQSLEAGRPISFR